MGVSLGDLRGDPGEDVVRQAGHTEALTARGGGRFTPEVVVDSIRASDNAVILSALASPFGSLGWGCHDQAGEGRSEKSGGDLHGLDLAEQIKRIEGTRKMVTKFRTWWRSRIYEEEPQYVRSRHILRTAASL